MSDMRLGVFLCGCGERVSSIIDLDIVERSVRKMPGVTNVRQLRYACSPHGLDAIHEAIDHDGLERVVVASCTPRTVASRFEGACQAAGLPGDLCHVVDIREGCAWVHSAEPRAATQKAIDLVAMGVAQVSLRQPREPVQAELPRRALVLGGGLSGLTSAAILADSGVAVTLVERGDSLGGWLREMHTLHPDGQDASSLLAERIQAVREHSMIDVLLRKHVTAVSRNLGSCTIRVNGSGCSDDSLKSFEVGAIIVATGADTLEPDGLYHYDGERVVTQLEFERELAQMEGSEGAKRALSSVVMILCAGQRTEQVPYCSGGCCVLALKQAVEIKETSPDTEVSIIFRDLNLLGRIESERQLLRARELGVKFIRYHPEEQPVVLEDQVAVADQLSGVRQSIPYDRVVLATPLVPQHDNGVVAHLLRIAQDSDGFFPQVRSRLRPENHPQRGIYICGAAHRPCDWLEAEFEATVAAFQAVRYLRKGLVSRTGNVAIVDEERCSGCGTCSQHCPFGAISMRQRQVLDVAHIDPLLCTGCGNCVVVCPVKAISTPGNSDMQIMAQIEAGLGNGSDEGVSRILVFGCEWSGFAAAELAGARGLTYPTSVRMICVPCSARIDPIHILWAFFSGADGVLIGACSPGDCHYRGGNRLVEQRVERVQSLLSSWGFDARRLQLHWIAPDDCQDFVFKIRSFAELVEALGPSSVRDERLDKGDR
jgi:heterodisulfide reductase subunit A